MNPEPLTKEKNIIFYKPITCKYYKEEGKVGWCEKRGFTGKAEHFWMFCADCKKWEQKDVKLISIEKVKQRVNWLLKEIEKVRVTTPTLQKIKLDEKTLLWCKQKIKKAFEGVVDEEKSV